MVDVGNWVGELINAMPHVKKHIGPFNAIIVGPIVFGGQSDLEVCPQDLIGFSTCGLTFQITFHVLRIILCCIHLSCFASVQISWQMQRILHDQV